MQNKFSVIFFMAFLAVVAVNGAMQLVYALAARFLVQAVNVLSHDRRQLPRLLQLCQLTVGCVWLRVQTQHLFTVEIKKLRRVPHIKAVAQHFLRRIAERLVIQAVYTAKIGNPAFCGYSRSAEKHNPAAFVYHLLKLLHLCHSESSHRPFSFLYLSLQSMENQAPYLFCQFYRHANRKKFEISQKKDCVLPASMIK